MKVKVITMPEEEFKELLIGILKPIHDEIHELRANNDVRTYSLREAAEISQVPYKTLLNAAKNGRLKALHDNNTFRVTRTNLLDFVKGDQE